MVRITYIFILLLVLDVGVATAQPVVDNKQMITVTGKVVSVTDDEPLIGAMVAVKGTQRAVATDFEGRFSIEAPRGSILVVTYVGYDKAEVAVDDTTKIVRLIPAKPISGWIYCDGNGVPQPQSDTTQHITVTGRVFTETDEEPVVGASVVIEGTGIGVATDVDGNFSLDAWLGAVLKVTYVGYETIKKTVCGNVMYFRLLPERISQFWPIAPTMNLAFHGRYIYGHVYDHYGRPLPGAVIETTSSAKDVTTDDSGYFAIDAQTGDSIRVSCPHYQSVEGIVEAFEFDIRLDPESVTGQVVAASDGQPLVAATVSYRNSANGQFVPKVVSDYDGRFELDFVPEDSLMVQLIGYKTQKFLPSGDSILVRLEDDPTVVFGCPTIVMYPISGVVLDEKGEPIIGAAVRVKDTNRVVPTGCDGDFRISAQKDDVLEITYIGYKTQTKKVSIKKPMKIKMRPVGHHFP